MQRDLNLLGDSFSIIGTKKLAFSDDPGCFIRFSDTGGLLGQPVDRKVSFAKFCDDAESLVAPESSSGLDNKFFGHLHCKAAEYLFFGSPSSKELLNLLFKWWKEPQVPKLWFSGKARTGEVESFREYLARPQNQTESLWNIDLLTLLLDQSLLPIRLHVNAQRAYVHVLNCAPAELPLSSLSLSLTGNSLECRNRLLIENKTLNGFTLEFPTSQFATAYLEKLGLIDILCQDDETAKTQRTLVGLIGQVRADGIIAGRPIDASLSDARIDSNTLTVLDRSTGAHICALDLDAPNLAIDGTAEEFVVSPDYSTAIRITSDSKDFLLAVYQNRATQDAATRTSHSGPFIATNNDGFVRIDNSEVGATISVNGSEPTQIETNIAEPTLSLFTKKPAVVVGDFELRAELPSLEGIFATLKGLTVKSSVAAKFEAAIAQIVGLEGHYLTF